MRYQPVTSAELRTHVGARPGTRTVHDVVMWNMHGRGVTSGGIYNRRPRRGLAALTPQTASLHAVGRAFDAMIPPAERRPGGAGDQLYLRLIAAAVPLGICEVIWQHKRWTPDKGERPYRPNNHHDHVHAGQIIDWADRPQSSDLTRWTQHFLFG
jgi:hypothetical protein